MLPDLEKAFVEVNNEENELAAASVEENNGENELAAASVEENNGENELAAASDESKNGENVLAAASVVVKNGENELEAASVEEKNGENELAAAASVEVKNGENELAAASDEEKNRVNESSGYVEVNNAVNELFSSSSHSHLENNLQDSVVASSSVQLENNLQDSVVASSSVHFRSSVDAFSSEDEDDLQNAREEYNLLNENDLNQLVVYDPLANGSGEIVPVTDHMDHRPRTGVRNYNLSSRVLPSVGAFTVQCANCFKWRLIPTKQKYEEIREFISENPFYCETAREWRPDISCDDPADLHQDGSRLWAIDKPNIAQPPPGWQRLLRIRGEGGSKFADVYYVAPSGKRLRSMVEIQRYLCQHPEYATEAVQPSQFSFQIPKPLQENYVRKRPARLPAIEDGNHLEMPRLLEPSEANPLAWAGPGETNEQQLGLPGLSAPYFEAPVFDPVNRPAKKQARSGTPKEMLSNLQTVKLEEPHRSINEDRDL